MHSKSVFFIFIALFFSLAALPTHAFTIDEPLPIPAEETRARELFQEIRCVVCSGESVAESGSEVARDIRRTVRKKIAAGENVASIKDFLVSRYGDGILMRPPLGADTWLLWFGPLAILLLATSLSLSYFRKNTSP